MLSSFKGMEQRREAAMRVIEHSSKAKLVEELQVREQRAGAGAGAVQLGRYSGNWYR